MLINNTNIAETKKPQTLAGSGFYCKFELPLKQIYMANLQQSSEGKNCTICKQFKPFSDFYKGQWYYSGCKDCVNKRNSEKRKRLTEYYLYCLKDPRNNEIRYVGCTKDLAKRLAKHLRNKPEENTQDKWAWINELLNAGLRPVLQTLETSDKTHWPDREKFWIAYFRLLNCDLLNKTIGGTGIVGIPIWNKGTKGIMKANEGTFKKGEHRSAATEIKQGQRLSPKTEFKKGQLPHNSKPVIQKTLDGDIVAEYPTLGLGAKAVGGWYNLLKKAALENKPYKNFLWQIK